MWFGAEQEMKSHINLECAIPAPLQDLGSDGQGMGGSSSPFFCQFRHNNIL